ncbi:hypothetical protein E7T09_16260 [Deinococcus sp. KSM4-11]|uniref:hypothetical protein n=1 Tax=Deinococcus sp. KSM4-11 TaxID=2568654 RepID=UPI0010A4421E|nr:hypothetical protein [Deinococcus sp. KSM4-11]THF85509.1 hypothetical protein E7T09_16260 [Deinococcus sp. KSM4-11]
MTDTTTPPATPPSPERPVENPSDPLSGTWLDHQDAPTDGAAPDPLTTKNGQQLRRWSEVVGTIPEAERMLAILDFEEALNADIIIAAPLNETVTVRYLGRNNRVVEHKMGEELILIPDDASAIEEWIQTKRTETTYALLKADPKFRVSIDSLREGHLDVATIHAMRKQARQVSSPPTTKTDPKAPVKPATKKGTGGTKGKS